MSSPQVIPHPLRQFRLPGVLLGMVLLYGTGGYLLIQHWSVFDSLYMTVITISTVGYGEVHPLSSAGRLFTMTLIAGGVASMIYAIGIFAELLSDGRLARYRSQRSMDRQISNVR